MAEELQNYLDRLLEDSNTKQKDFENENNENENSED